MVDYVVRYAIRRDPALPGGYLMATQKGGGFLTTRLHAKHGVYQEEYPEGYLMAKRDPPKAVDF